MKSRAELLAELEEKRIENNKIQTNIEEFSISEPEAATGYNPYDNPSLGKKIRADVDVTKRRRSLLRRKR